jgi:hypothetical protein
MRRQVASRFGQLLWHRRWQLLLATLMSLLPLVPLAAQTPSNNPTAVPAASGRLPTSVPDSVPVPADTTRQTVPLEADAAEPSATQTPRSTTRILGVIVLVTLTTLLLYNVRSR